MAVTFTVSLTVTVHVVAVPLHAPLHPVNVEPAVVVADRFSPVDPGTVTQPLPQLSAGFAGSALVAETVPLPTVEIVTIGAKTNVVALLELMVTSQTSAPAFKALQALDQE